MSRGGVSGSRQSKSLMLRFCLVHSLRICNASSVKPKILRQQNKSWKSIMKFLLVKPCMDLKLINVTKTQIRLRRLLSHSVRLLTRDKSLILLRNQTRLLLKSTNVPWIFGFRRGNARKYSNSRFTKMTSLLTNKVKRTKLPSLRNVLMSERMRIRPISRRSSNNSKLRKIKNNRSWSLKRLSTT